MGCIRRFALAAALAAMATACGGDANPLVSFEAHWLCDVQRQTFAELSDIDTAFELALSEAGFSRSDYEAFRARLSESASLRDHVSQEYDAYCAS